MIKDDAIRIKLVKTLLDKKADPSSVNNEGQTPMSLAQAKKRLASNSEKKQTWLKIIQMLKDAGATE